MNELRNVSRTVQVLLMTAAVLGLAATAVADTIYLKNGRVIRTSEVRVEGDKVHFRQYTGMVAIPMSIVDRIEEDEMTGPEARQATRSTPRADEAASTEEGADEAAGTEEGDGEGVPPEETREYWQERVSANAAERQQLEETLERLRREERAFLFSQRSTAETRRQIEETQQRLDELDQEMEEIRQEARQQGVPPGWLRVQETSGAGGTPGEGGTSGSTGIPDATPVGVFS